MDGLARTCSAGGRFLLLPIPSTSSRKQHHSSTRFPFVHRRRHGRPFLVLSSRDGPPPELSQLDQMELKFGRLLGEDPNLTLAKIKGRKANPNASYVEIEKSFYKKKGKMADDEVVEVPLDWNVREKDASESKQKLQQSSSFDLRTPVPANKSPGVQSLNLSRPDLKGRAHKPDVSTSDESVSPDVLSYGQVPERVPMKPKEDPGVTLRKPAQVQEDDLTQGKPSKLKIKPNLLLKMRKGPGSEDLSEVNLLKKPEVIKISVDVSSRDISPLDASSNQSSELQKVDELAGSTYSMENVIERSSEGGSGIVPKPVAHDENDQKSLLFCEEKFTRMEALNSNANEIYENMSVPSPLQGKPERPTPDTKETSLPIGINNAPTVDAVPSDTVDDIHISEEQEEQEVIDWKRAEDLFQAEGRDEVELISCSSRGFVVSFGSLVGFLPYRNLGAKWKFLAFESWLRKKGLDPSLYRPNLSLVGNYAIQNKEISMSSSETSFDGEKIAQDAKIEDLLEMYEQEKTKFLSSFIGQRVRVSVVLVDRKSRKLMFSGRPKEKEELVERKRSVMSKLSVGDIVKCCIKKITYFGIFVEVEGVPALIHQSEISWDAALDPSSFFKIGQILDAKVHQLDYALERITLSLKEIMPDPLSEAIESVVGDRSPLGNGNMEIAQGDIEWPDVDALIKELEQITGVIGVSKGRFFLSPGLAPTFQVYMASMYENQYKLLARYENKVQEVIVQASLDKDQMKEAILTCTNRVQ